MLKFLSAVSSALAAFFIQLSLALQFWTISNDSQVLSVFVTFKSARWLSPLQVHFHNGYFNELLIPKFVTKEDS